jgi:hypothetical protein
LPRFKKRVHHGVGQHFLAQPKHACAKPCFGLWGENKVRDFRGLSSILKFSIITLRLDRNRRRGHRRCGKEQRGNKNVSEPQFDNPESCMKVTLVQTAYDVGHPQV